MKTKHIPSRTSRKLARAWMNAALKRHPAARNGKPKELKPERNGHPKKMQVENEASFEYRRTFAEWLALFDRSIGERKARRIAWKEARQKARTPLQLLELYFRTGIDGFSTEEAALLRKLKRLRAPSAAWLEFLLQTEPSKLTVFVVERRLGRARLAQFHEKAVGQEKRALADHLELPKERFGR